MMTHRFVGQIRRAMDLETDQQATVWAGEALAAYLGAIRDDLLMKRVIVNLPDRLVALVRRSRASLGGILPLPDSIAELIGASEAEADHLLRVVWQALADLISPSDLVTIRATYPPRLVQQLERYELEAEDEKDALHGDVAVYQYESEMPPPGAILSGGDVDAAWQEAESSGEEAAGGSVITPDQDVVEEIGEALGVTYRFDETLRPVEKEAARDRTRWEMDPASAEDFRSRNHPRKGRHGRR